ncbi:MAG: DUF2723 domain-containing protein [Anaerolineales bacterium]|nr:DUF2723 domain-containing protein [Anaerolineales bacterium]
MRASYPVPDSPAGESPADDTPAGRLARLLARIDRAAVAAFALPLLLYLLTLAPTIYNLDSAELTTAAATGGILRATGYPLYLALGKLWALLPVGDVGYRFNLLSAVCAALTILQAELILRRLRVGGLARLGALGLLATAPYFWSMSLIAEVYTLHTALMAGVILSLLRWAEQPTPLRFALPVFLMALSMGNHAATVLLIPGSVLFVLLRHPRQLLRPRVWLAGALGAAVGLSIFLTLPLRHAANPAFNYAGSFDGSGVFHPVNLQSLEGILWLITGRSFAGQMFGYSLREVSGEFFAYGVELWQAFVAVGIGPGLLGALLLLRRDWRTGGLLSLMFALNVLFYVNYRVVDKNTMFLPTYLIWALWLGVGYQAVLNWLRRTDGPRSLATWGARLVMITAIFFAITWNGPRVDQSEDVSTRQQSEEILRLVEPNAIVLGWWETVPGVQYLQFVEGQRPDVLAINRFLISGADMETLIRTQAPTRPIYINNPPLSLIQTMRVTKVGPLYRLQPARAAH